MTDFSKRTAVKPYMKKADGGPMDMRPVGGVTGEEWSPGNALPGNIANDLMKAYAGEAMKGPQGQKLMKQQRQQGDAVIKTFRGK